MKCHCHIGNVVPLLLWLNLPWLEIESHCYFLSKCLYRYHEIFWGKTNPQRLASDSFSVLLAFRLQLDVSRISSHFINTISNFLSFEIYLSVLISSSIPLLQYHSQTLAQVVCNKEAMVISIGKFCVEIFE